MANLNVELENVELEKLKLEKLCNKTFIEVKNRYNMSTGDLQCLAMFIKRLIDNVDVDID